MLVPADTFNRQTIRACESKMIWLRVSHDGLEAAAQGHLLPAWLRPSMQSTRR